MTLAHLLSASYPNALPLGFLCDGIGKSYVW